MWNSFKMLRTKDWLKLQEQDYIFYFSGPRSHWVYRKSQYYQGGMRCCFMMLLLKMLSDMLQNPRLLSHIHISPTPYIQLGPTDSFYPAPPSSVDIATARSPSLFGQTEMSDRSHRDCNGNSLFPFRNTSVQPRWVNRSHRVFLSNSLCAYY